MAQLDGISIFIRGTLVAVSALVMQSPGILSQGLASTGISIEEALTKAVADYNGELYAGCIKSMESGLIHYRMLKHIDINCNLRCAAPDIAKEVGLDMSGLEDLTDYGNIIAQANCVKICREEHHFSKSNIQRPSKSFVEDIESRLPYNYLQFAYYQTGMIKEACQAAYTFFQVNPEDQQMRQNLEFYKGLDDFRDEYFIDLEGKPFVKNFVDGAIAYEAKEYKKAVKEMEKALHNFLDSYEECKALCYVGKPTEFFYSLHQSIAERYLPAINCTLNCEFKLRSLIGDRFLDNFVAKCFSYLQFSYYQLDNWSMAVPAAASEFLLDPEDEKAHSNLEYYRNNGPEHKLVSEIHYQPRADAIKYHLEKKTNKRLLELIMNLVDYHDEEEVEIDDDGKASLPDNLIEEITKQITVTISEKLRGDIG